MECFLYYLNHEPKYLVFEEDGRDKMIERWGAERVAARDWDALSDAEQSRWKQLTKEENDRRAAALKEYEAKLAASWRACERLADLKQSRDHSYPEFAPTPSPKKIYLEECAARPAGQTTLECHDATRLALLEVPDPIKAACVTKATTLRRGRWKEVRGFVPSPLRALGDASAEEPCTWDQGAAFVTIDVAACPRLAARLAEVRRLQGLPEPLSPLPKLDADAEVDEDSWRSASQTAARRDRGSHGATTRGPGRAAAAAGARPGSGGRQKIMQGRRRRECTSKFRCEDPDLVRTPGDVPQRPAVRTGRVPDRQRARGGGSPTPSPPPDAFLPSRRRRRDIAPSGAAAPGPSLRERRAAGA